MSEPTTWIVLADGARARFLHRQQPGFPLTETEVLQMTLRGHVRRRGWAGEIDEGASHRPLVQPHENRKEAQERHFLCHVAGHINASVADDAVKNLVLIAPLHALGILRAHLSHEASAKITLEIARDITHAKTSDLEKRLSKFGV